MVSNIKYYSNISTILYNIFLRFLKFDNLLSVDADGCGLLESTQIKPFSFDEAVVRSS